MAEPYYTTATALRTALGVSSGTLSDGAATTIITQAEDWVDNLLGGWYPDETTGRKILQADVLAWQWEKLGRATITAASALYNTPTLLTAAQYRKQSGPDFSVEDPQGGGALAPRHHAPQRDRPAPPHRPRCRRASPRRPRPSLPVRRLRLMAGPFGTTWVEPAPTGPLYPDGLQPGVLWSTDCALAYNSASQVTIAAGQGVWVQNAAGVLVRTTPVSTVLGSIPAASASNFRLDQVVVDSAGVISRVAGTQGTTVTLANRTGAGAVPSGSLLLHDLLVSSAGVVNNLTTNLRDRRPWAKGYNCITQYSAADLTTTSATMADITQLSQRAEISGNNVLHLQFRAAWLDTGANGCDIQFRNNAGGLNNDLGRHVQTTTRLLLAYHTTVGTGSTLLSVAWAAGTGGQTNTLKSTFGMEFSVREIVAQNANNGTA